MQQLLTLQALGISAFLYVCLWFARASIRSAYYDPQYSSSKESRVVSWIGAGFSLVVIITLFVLYGWWALLPIFLCVVLSVVSMVLLAS